MRIRGYLFRAPLGLKIHAEALDFEGADGKIELGGLRGPFVPIHPCEILGDLADIRTKRGSLKGLKVVFAGESTNLPHPWFAAATRLRQQLTSNQRVIKIKVTP